MKLWQALRLAPKNALDDSAPSEAPAPAVRERPSLRVKTGLRAGPGYQNDPHGFFDQG